MLIQHAVVLVNSYSYCILNTGQKLRIQVLDQQTSCFRCIRSVANPPLAGFQPTSSAQPRNRHNAGGHIFGELHAGGTCAEVVKEVAHGSPNVWWCATWCANLGSPWNLWSFRKLLWYQEENPRIWSFDSSQHCEKHRKTAAEGAAVGSSHDPDSSHTGDGENVYFNDSMIMQYDFSINK